MTKNKSAVDKNLQNVVDDLEQEPVNAHHANQLQRQTEDRRHQDNLNHKKHETDLNHPLS
ncbi:hypothetical protein M3223_23865 [Paenibacillus pasadenensis]|uniref:hypothetical protein n=1 Tax=Paenibacillus pasadenensis TaxID=217090 RepID=UPI00203E0FF5|nr:hypothetical protein [Paenibacillus pasadenensis]MCM3750346.1 hypothetical protein [Paenibacillus pasadenensis]